jgi:predicted PurR-regulated permease PerM
VAAVLALLPAGGAALIWIPGVIALAIKGKLGLTIALGIWGIVISLIDNVLRPFLVASKAPVSTLMVFIGAVGGASAFGMLGLILGPVILSLTDALLRFADPHYEAELRANRPDSDPPQSSLPSPSETKGSPWSEGEQGMSRR